MKYIKKENIFHLSRKIGSKRPVTFGIIAAVFSYSLLALMANISLIFSRILPPEFSELYSLTTALILNYPGSVESYALTITVLTSLLIGLNTALLVQTVSFEGLAAAPGAFLGMTLSGCAACTTGAISLAGASIGLSFLPYGGLEASILGIGLLIFSALYISEKDRQKICEI